MRYAVEVTEITKEQERHSVHRYHHNLPVMSYYFQSRMNAAMKHIYLLAIIGINCAFNKQQKHQRIDSLPIGDKIEFDVLCKQSLY